MPAVVGSEGGGGIINSAGSGAAAGGSFGGGYGALAGGIIGGLSSFLGGASANAANSEAAQRARGLTRELANTAIQRRVADLKAANLNPMLAYENAAATPTIEPAHFENPAKEAVPAVSSAVEAAAVLAENKVRESQIRNLDVDSIKKASEYNVNEETASLTRFKAIQEQILTAKTFAEKDKLRQELPKVFKLKIVNAF